MSSFLPARALHYNARFSHYTTLFAACKTGLDAGFCLRQVSSVRSQTVIVTAASRVCDIVNIINEINELTKQYI